MSLPSTNADHHAVARRGSIAAAEEEKDGRTPVEIAPSRPVKPWNRRLDHEPYAGQGPRVLVPAGARTDAPAVAANAAAFAVVQNVEHLPRIAGPPPGPAIW